MEQPEPTVLLSGLKRPECPRWHEGRLWFTDGGAGTVMAVDLAGKSEVVSSFPGHPAGLDFLPDGGILVVDSEARRLTRLTPGGAETVADLSSMERTMSNDMVVDAQGRAYVGGSGYKYLAEPERPTNIVLVADGEARVAASEMFFPNGMVITPDGGTLIVGETLSFRLTAFRIQPDGLLTDRRVFAQFEKETPDGICLDAEGAVWMASPGTREVMRVLDGGKVTQRIPFDQRRPFACILGGDDRRTLFMCTARMSFRNPDVPPEGWIESVRVDVPGAGLP